MLDYEFSDYNSYKNNKNYRIKENGEVKSGLTVIADGFIETEAIIELSRNMNSTKYHLKFSVISQDGLEERDIKFFEHFAIIFTTYRKSDINKDRLIIKLNNRAQVIELLGIHINIRDENKFISALKNYIEFSLNTAYENNNVVNGYIGWNLFLGENSISFGFFGVTYNSLYDYIDEAMFNSTAKRFKKGYFDMTMYEVNEMLNENAKIIAELNLSNRIEKLLTFIMKNSAFLICFAYNLLAIGDQFIRKLNGDEKTERFAMAVCGVSKRKNITSKKFANIFFNSFSVNFDKLNSIDYKFNINCSKVKFDIEDVMIYRNITMLVSGKNYVVNLNNSRVQKIFEFLNSDMIRFYPVFVSKKGFNVAEIEEIDIATIYDFPESKEELIEIKETMNSLYTIYIYYLTKFAYDDYKFFLYREIDLISYLSENKKSLIAKIHEFFVRFRKTIREDDRYDINKENISIKLQDAVTLFFFIFNKYSNDISIETNKKLLEYSFEVMKKRALRDEVTDESISNISLFYKYINAIFVDKSHCPNYKYWEGIEKRGSNKECYYLEYGKYFDDFCRYVKINIRQSDFNAELKEINRIVMKDDKTSIGVYRVYHENGNPKRLYVLAVKKMCDNDK